MSDTVLRQKVLLLAGQSRTAFAASCAERLIDVYRAYCIQENTGDYQALRAALDFIWHILDNTSHEHFSIQSYIQQSHRLLPNTDSTYRFWTLPALSAVSAVINALYCAMDPQDRHVIAASSCPLDAIYEYAFALGDPSIGYSLFQHSMNDMPNVDMTIRRLVLERMREWHDHQNVLRKWIITSPLLIAEYDHQQEDIKILLDEGLAKSVLEQIRTLSRLEGILPFARNLVPEKPNARPAPDS